MTRLLRVLVLVPGSIQEKPTGPSIRAWETARAFATAGHRVTAIATASETQIHDGIKVVPRSRRRIARELTRHDILYGSNLPPYALAELTARRCLRVADLYDPLDLELASSAGRGMRLARSAATANRLMHVRWADLIISGSERQHERLLDDLKNVSRSDGGPELMVVPMGLPDPPPPTEGHPLRERFAAIAPTDPVILWWGLVWRWLDARTAIEAVARLAAKRPTVRLVFTAGRPANARTNSLNATEEARNFARTCGLLDRNVFFLDEWVPYEDRHRYLRDANLGLTLPGHSGEASLAARFRYMDYVWAGLPCVLGAGDERGGELAASGAAWLVPPGDPDATADTIHKLLSDPRTLEAAGQACQQIADQYRWSRLLAPVVMRVQGMAPVRRPSQTPQVASDAGRYYARRLLEMAVLPARR